MEIVANEIKRLVEDYNKCPYLLIKEQIGIDIELLEEALFILNNEPDLNIHLDLF